MAKLQIIFLSFHQVARSMVYIISVSLVPPKHKLYNSVKLNILIGLFICKSYHSCYLVCFLLTFVFKPCFEVVLKSQHSQFISWSSIFSHGTLHLVNYMLLSNKSFLFLQVTHSYAILNMVVGNKYIFKVMFYLFVKIFFIAQ